MKKYHASAWPERLINALQVFYNRSDGMHPSVPAMEQFLGLLHQMLFLTLFFGRYFVAPALLVWDWVRWMRSIKPLTFWPMLSVIGFFFVSASYLCAVSLFLYSLRLGGGLQHFDDRLFMGIFQ